jgi:cysteamine dioxygenase
MLLLSIFLSVYCSVSIRPIHEKITPSTEDASAVRYLHLSEVPDQYSMGIFVFPPHAKIPLHDHPGMCVLSRVLYGSLHRLSLDLPRETKKSITGSRSDSWLSSWNHPTENKKKISPTSSEHWEETQHPGPRKAYKNHVDHLQAPECTVLYPFEGNLHEFVAGPHGAAVLDVLLPPYDVDHHRDCTFYHIRPYQQDSEHEEDVMGDREPCVIVPTGQPEDFHCISGHYGELGEQ